MQPRKFDIAKWQLRALNLGGLKIGVSLLSVKRRLVGNGLTKMKLKAINLNWFSSVLKRPFMDWRRTSVGRSNNNGGGAEKCMA